TATVVRASGGEVLTTDGPFAESKDHLGGFYIVEAADLDVAIGWAAKVTAAIKVPIEVRPFAAFADEPAA
ncbi:MAG: YciI family protein, partial [Pseudonocardiaceae bacterium]